MSMYLTSTQICMRQSIQINVCTYEYIYMNMCTYVLIHTCVNIHTCVYHTSKYGCVDECLDIQPDSNGNGYESEELPEKM